MCLRGVRADVSCRLAEDSNLTALWGAIPGFHDPSGPLREEDVIRIRGLTVHNSKSKDSDTDKGQTEWSLNAFSRPLPVRENGQVLIRSIASTPVLDGNAGALAVALGYSE